MREQQRMAAREAALLNELAACDRQC